MLSSVRFRLTCWYVGGLAVILVVFSVGVYGALARQVYRNIDASLASSLEMFSRSLMHEIEENGGGELAEQRYREVVETVFRESYPEQAIAVYQGQRLVVSKPGPYGEIPPAPGEVGEGVRYATLPISHQSEPDRTAARAIRVPQGSYAVTSSRSLADAGQELAAVRGVFYVAIPVALAATALGGYFLARKSLAPVLAMSQTAETISSRDLSQRVPVVHPGDELGRLASTFNGLLDRMQQSFERQKQFMADSSHELKTPVFVAATAAQVVLSEPRRTEPEYRDALATIQTQMTRLSELVENMFLLARADAGVYPVEARDFYLDEAIAETARAANLLGTPRGIQVRAASGPEAPCRGDEGLIRQMVMILVENAIKHGNEGGAVEITLDPSDPTHYAILVRDTGPGISPEAQPRIFDRFFRENKARSRSQSGPGGGAGLGLAIGRWIAQRHGGNVTLESTGPAGSTFRATILKN